MADFLMFIATVFYSFLNLILSLEVDGIKVVDFLVYALLLGFVLKIILGDHDFNTVSYERTKEFKARMQQKKSAKK